MNNIKYKYNELKEIALTVESVEPILLINES